MKTGYLPLNRAAVYLIYNGLFLLVTAFGIGSIFATATGGIVRAVLISWGIFAVAALLIAVAVGQLLAVACGSLKSFGRVIWKSGLITALVIVIPFAILIPLSYSNCIGTSLPDGECGPRLFRLEDILLLLTLVLGPTYLFYSAVNLVVGWIALRGERIGS